MPENALKAPGQGNFREIFRGKKHAGSTTPRSAAGGLLPALRLEIDVHLVAFCLRLRLGHDNF
ncbi:MAG TPA: hypothetical protein PKO38_07460, partial [Bacillota bacterium]|nr:hypothetical protein [Bacillota bacterium]